MAKKLLIVTLVVLALASVSLFLPAREMSIESIGKLSFETRVTLSIGSETAYANPDIEIRQPDGDISTGFWTTAPLWSKIDEGSATPDGTYIVCPNNRNSTGECSVQDPTNVGTYTDVQINVYARKSAAGGAERGLAANIRINGNLQGQQTLTTSLTNAWTQYTYTWSGLSFTQSDMNTLQILFISTGRTGGQNLRQVWIDYYEVILNYTPPAPPPDWLCGWDNRVKLTIDRNDIGEPLTNFPVLVYLSNSSGRGADDVSFVFDELQSDANRLKIAVTTSDGTTECYVEIEKWTQASEIAWLWVRVPSISNSVDTDLYLYYDRDQVDNTTYVGDSGSRPEVWDTNYKLVLHLGESSTVYDSTLNNNDETNPPPEPPSPGYYRATYTDSGRIDGGYSFSNDGTYGSRLQAAHNSSLDITQNVTLEAFVYLNDRTDGKFIAKDDPFPGGAGCYNLQQETSSLQFALDLGGWYRATYATYNTGEWYYVAGTYDRTMMRLYLNGTQVATNPQTAAITSGAVNMALGNRADDAGIDFDLNGRLDEIRISDSPRSAAWIRASYESGRDNLIDFGAEEPFPADIVNIPPSKDFGNVSENSEYWSNGAAPVFPLDDLECFFMVTNNSPCSLDISIRATNFGGGVGWTLTGGIPGENTVKMKAGQSGDIAESDMVSLTTGDQDFIEDLPVSESKMWEIKLETGTFTDSIQKTSTITLTATSS